jgi:2-methylcitrate dehydratase
LIHGQAVIDAALQIRTDEQLVVGDVDDVHVDVCQGAYDFGGGGSYGDNSEPGPRSRPTTT